MTVKVTGYQWYWGYTYPDNGGFEVISKVPVVLHTPLMSGSNFVHGIVLVGAMVALGKATTGLELAIGFFAVALAVNGPATIFGVPA
mgnify:CR=1 FL=1